MAATRRVTLGLAALTALGWPLRASAASRPEDVVDGLVQQIIDLLQSGELNGDQAFARLAGVIDNTTDLDRLGRLVLGRHWRAASEAQRTEYLELFRQLMLRKFIGHLGAYSGDRLPGTDRLFELGGRRSIGDHDVLVSSRVQPPDRPPLDVVWRLRGQNGGWVIIDMIVENVSLLISQRSEFGAVIERVGIDGLLRNMRERLAQPPT